MKHIIRLGIVGIVLTLSSGAAERGPNSPEINYDLLWQNDQRGSILIDLENLKAPLLSNQGDGQDSISFEEKRTVAICISPLCFAQIIGQTRLCYIWPAWGESGVGWSQWDHTVFALNALSVSGGISCLFLGGFLASLYGIIPSTLGLLISGAILSTPTVFSSASELIYRCASCLGEEDFVKNADDVGAHRIRLDITIKDT